MAPSPIPSNIKKFLKVLGMKESFISGGAKVPSYAAVRKAFRDRLLKGHPDKGGKTPSFQELTEASREVFAYIEENPEMVEEQDEADTDTPEEKDNLKELLRIFSTSSELKYNKECVVFNIEKEQVAEWMSKFSDYFDRERKPDTTGDSTLFQIDDWVLPEKKGEEMKGSLTVTLYPNPKTIPKVMVQGKMYMAFVTMALPVIAMSVLKKVPLPITDKSKGNKDKASSEKDKVKVKETATKEGNSQKEKGGKGVDSPKDINTKDAVAVDEQLKEDEVPEEDNIEKETVKEKELANSDDISKNKDDIEELISFENDPENIREALNRFQRAFINKCGDIDNKMTVSLEKQADMTKHITALKEEVSNLKEEVKMSKDEIKTALKEEVIILKEEIKVAKDEIKTEMKDAGDKGDAFKQNMDKKINSVLDACKDIQKKIDVMKESMASKLGVTKAIVDNPEIEAKDPTEGEVIEVEENTKKKVIFFHSSVATDLDRKRFENATNSDMVMVKTACLLANGSTVKPGEFLVQTVADNMKDDINLAIFAVGSNDVANIQEDDTLEIGEKIAAVKKQSEHLVHIADNLVKENNNLEAFIVEQIPRHDNPERTKLQKLANSFLDIRITESSSRLHLVSQSSLFRQPGEARDRTYRNGNHLTANGLYHYNTNLISEIQEVFTDMKGLDIHPPKQVKKTEQVQPAGGIASKQQQQLPAKGPGQQRKGYQNYPPQQPPYPKPREQQHPKQQGLTWAQQFQQGLAKEQQVQQGHRDQQLKQQGQVGEQQFQQQGPAKVQQFQQGPAREQQGHDLPYPPTTSPGYWQPPQLDLPPGPPFQWSPVPGPRQALPPQPTTTPAPQFQWGPVSGV